jgi:hypothetical protein
MPNTFNVCLGHVPFPHSHDRHIDLMVAPRLIEHARRLALVEDSLFGPNGSALSEYAQLLWLHDHLESLAMGRDFIRIFHYRRFVAASAPTVGQRSSNLTWATVIRADDLPAFDQDFDRSSRAEIFNTPVRFGSGMLFQYASDHVLEDMLNFAKFLTRERILTDQQCALFLANPVHIPSCNIGVYKKACYLEIFGLLRRAAGFLHAPEFVIRKDYQRRSVGFLLERLNSFLILRRIEAGHSVPSFGHNIVISESSIVSHTL